MRSRYTINEPHSAYFVTSTIVNWLPIFTTAARCDILIQSFLHCRQHKSLQIHAWVVLDNHFHAILSGPDLPATLRSFKGFTAQVILQQLKFEKCDWLLDQLALHRAEHKRTSEHQVWQEGVHPQAIGNDTIMQQKLEYLHQNPVKRGLVAAPEHWRFSSAHEWLVGACPMFKCDSWK